MEQQGALRQQGEGMMGQGRRRLETSWPLRLWQQTPPALAAAAARTCVGFRGDGGAAPMTPRPRPASGHQKPVAWRQRRVQAEVTVPTARGVLTAGHRPCRWPMCGRWARQRRRQRPVPRPPCPDLHLNHHSRAATPCTASRGRQRRVRLALRSCQHHHHRLPVLVLIRPTTVAWCRVHCMSCHCCRARHHKGGRRWGHRPPLLCLERVRVAGPGGRSWTKGRPRRPPGRAHKVPAPLPWLVRSRQRGRPGTRRWHRRSTCGSLLGYLLRPAPKPCGSWKP